MLDRLGKKLVAWGDGAKADGKTGANAAALKRLQRQLDAVCRQVEGEDRAACEGLLKAPAKAA